MEISTAIHRQTMLSSHGVKHEVLTCPEAHGEEQEQLLQQQEKVHEKMARPNPEQALTCPRCESTNTKFCYYNNYSLSQPRYFCKGCRRYWTQGGSLRNVPIGGGCRKNTKRSSSSSSPSTVAAVKARQLQDQQAPLLPTPSPLPSFAYNPNDLTLAFNEFQKPNPLSMSLGLNLQDNFLLGSPAHTPTLPPPLMASAIPSPGFLDILRYGFLDPTNLNGFPNMCYGEDEGMMMPFEGGLSLAENENLCSGARTMNSSSSNTPTASNAQSSCRGIQHAHAHAHAHGGESKMVGGGGDQWNPHHVHHEEGSFMSVDQDYWNGMCPSSWHGLMNSSFI